MNEQKRDIDSLTRELVQKSILKPESSDFDEKLMGKIQGSPQPARWHLIGKSIRKGRLYLVLAICCFVATAGVIGEFLHEYYSKVDADLRITAGYIFYSGLGLSLLTVLYYFDKLLQTSISSRKWVLN